jgi:YVTN family beta-propeller protein
MKSVAKLENKQVYIKSIRIGTIIAALAIFVFASDDLTSRNVDGMKSIIVVNNILKFENPGHTIMFLYPANWKILTSSDNNVKLMSAGLSRSNFSINVSPFTLPLTQLIATDINDYKQTLTGFRLIDSKITNVAGSLGYMLIYSYQQEAHSYMTLRIWTSIEGKAFYIAFSSESQNYTRFLPTIQEMIKSLRIQSAMLHNPSRTNLQVHYPGLNTGSDPWDIAINPVTKRMYISNFLDNTVSVLDGGTDKLLTSIDSNGYPSTVSVNPATNRLYVANSGSNTVSVFSSSNQKIADIDVGKNPTDLAIDSISGGSSSLIFAANSGSDTVSVINGLTNKVLTNITVGHEPQAVSVNILTKRLYVANSGSNTVSVIDYFISKSGNFNSTTIANIHVGSFPIGVKINWNTNKLYVINSVINATLSVIDGSTTQSIANISVGSFPAALYTDPNTQFVYVSNAGSGTISVIDSSTNKKLPDIYLGGSPLAISSNPNTHILYVTNTAYRKVSEISDNKLVVGINFDVKPVSAGSIECSNKIKFSGSYYLRVPSGSSINCKAITNAGFLFSSWTSNFSPNSNNTETTFTASDFGNITAYFIMPVSIPKQLWEGFSSNLLPIIILPMVGAIAAWLIPSIAGWINGWIQRQNLRRYLDEIIKIRTTYQNDSNYPFKLEKKKIEIANYLTEGKISESQYTLLDKKISDYEEEAKNNNESNQKDGKREQESSSF